MVIPSLLFSNVPRRSFLRVSGTDASVEAVDIENILSQLYKRLATEANVSIAEVRDPLRRAAALLSDSNEIRPSVIHFLVNLPFEIFTDESIKLGISLWLGVINENPRAEPRILVEVEEAWERSIQRRKGLFDPSFEYAVLVQWYLLLY